MNKKGFTLLEILLVLVIAGLLVGPIYNTIILSARFQEGAGTRIELAQQARVIASRVESKVRNSRDVRIINEKRVFLNRGPDFFDCVAENCGPQTDCYLRLGVNDKQLYVERTTGAFAGSETVYPDWPQESKMGFRRPVTTDVIADHHFEIKQGTTFYYYFKLKSGTEEYVLENRVALDN